MDVGWRMFGQHNKPVLILETSWCIFCTSFILSNVQCADICWYLKVWHHNCQTKLLTRSSYKYWEINTGFSAKCNLEETLKHFLKTLNGALMFSVIYHGAKWNLTDRCRNDKLIIFVSSEKAATEQSCLIPAAVSCKSVSKSVSCIKHIQWIKMMPCFNSWKLQQDSWRCCFILEEKLVRFWYCVIPHCALCTEIHITPLPNWTLYYPFIIDCLNHIQCCSTYLWPHAYAAFAWNDAALEH